jgi:pimeloyl-ACP methyl ester carboxylesterase/tetratricopeptide (TPR) repeat protein
MRAISMAAVILLCGVPIVAAPAPVDRTTGALAPELGGLGTLHVPVSTTVPRAQRFFDQGMRLLYAFNHAEAIRAFREAARLDPDLAMAYWGEALALGPNLNAPMTRDSGLNAYVAVRRAVSVASRVTLRERVLIDALSARYASDGAGDRPALDRAYAAAMQTAADRFPDDPDVQTLYADAQMNTMPWDYWQKDGTPKAATSRTLDVLERVITRYPDHAGALHYHIHLLEASANPDRAESSADRLGGLMPAAGHLVHMPAHIYIRVGRYADAAEANERAIRADEDYLAQCQAQGLYPISYYPHNLHFLWAAATLEGRRAVAVDAARKVAEKVPHHHAGALSWTADYPVTPMLASVRFGLWQEVLTAPEPPSNEPYATGIWHYARGLAFVARAQLDRARAELAVLKATMTHQAFATTLKDLPLLTNLKIASWILQGELAMREGNAAAAIAALREAVTIEDGIPYSEPPVWHQPTRQILGALLLEAGRPADAERVYREDLTRVRENGWSLFGLMLSLRAQHRVEDAADIRRRFERAWARADIQLRSSRIMEDDRPGHRVVTTNANLGHAVARHETRTERHVDLPEGRRVNYIERGDRDGTPVVLVHGHADSWRSFERVVPYLPLSLRVFAVTWRGHRGAGATVTGDTPAGVARDLLAFLDTLGLDSVIVVGHSMGATVAQRFAIDHPERTRGLVLESAFVPRTGNEGLRALSETVWKSPLEPYLTINFAAQLTEISTPTLLVWGDRDTFVARTEQDALKRAIAGSRLVTYAGVGHSPHWEEPARFAAQIAGFVDDVETP